MRDGVFTKTVQGSRHMLHTPRAWALDAGIYDSLRPRVRQIVVTDKDSGYTYTASREVFDLFGGVIDRGFGRQRYLPLDKWQVTRPGEPKQLTFLETVGV